MKYKQSSKLPTWLRPLPPLVIVGGLVALGYGMRYPAYIAPAVVRSVDPSDFSLEGHIFKTPQNPQQQGDMSAENQSPQGESEDNPNSQNMPDMESPLELSEDSLAGAELQKFRNSPVNNLFGKALQDQQEGNIDAAIDGYRKVLHQMPDALPARLNLAVAYLQKGQLDKATPHLKIVAKADPQNVKVQMELAKVLLNQNRLGEAVAPLRQTIHMMPQNPEPRVLLAQLYYSQKNYQSAFDQWTALDKINAGGGQAAFAAGSIALQNLKKPKTALPWLRKAHKLAPENDDATLLLGQVLAETGNTKEAEPLLARIVAKAPNDANLLRILAETQWSNKHYDAAANSLRKIVALDPKDQKSRDALAQMLGTRAEQQEKDKKWAQASNTWKELGILLPDNPLPLLKRAAILQQLNRSNDAKPLYQNVLKQDAKNADALMGLASIALDKKDYSTGYDNFWKAIQANPRLSVAYEGFIFAADKANKKNEALSRLKNWSSKYPQLDDAKRAVNTLQSAIKQPEKSIKPPTPNTAPDINTDRPTTIGKTPVPPKQESKTDNKSSKKPSLSTPNIDKDRPATAQSVLKEEEKQLDLPRTPNIIMPDGIKIEPRQ